VYLNANVYYITTFVCPRTIVGVPFDSVRRFRTSLFLHTTCVNPYRNWVAKCVHFKTKSKKTPLLPSDPTFPVSSFPGHNHWGGHPPLNHGRAAATPTIGARQSQICLSSCSLLRSLCMHLLSVSMETGTCSAGRRVIHEQLGLTSVVTKDGTV